MRAFWSIARLTALEVMRQPICLLLVGSSVLMVSLLPVLITHTMGGAGKLVRDSALAVHLVSGMVLGAYAACSVLVREIHRGTASTVLSKPVSRDLFFLAKFLGVALVLAFFSLAMGLATILATRIALAEDALLGFDLWTAVPLWTTMPLACAVGAHLNFHRKRAFASTALAAMLLLLLAVFALSGLRDYQGARVPFGEALPLAIAPVSALVTLAILVLAAIAVSLAPRLELVPTIAVCAVVLMLGLVSDYLFGRPAEAGVTWARALYALIPNWQHLWVVDALGSKGRVPLPYMLSASAYAFLYLAGVLLLGMAGFKRTELK